jgi:hypothetical protein
MGLEVHHLCLVSRMPVDGTTTESGTCITVLDIGTVMMTLGVLKHKGHKVHHFCLVSRMVVNVANGKTGTLEWWF